MTIAEIANLAHVAPATVDRVLHNRGRVSKETAQHILDIVEKNGFEPNQYARNLRLNREYRFGVLIRDSDEDGYWQILKEGCIAATKDMKSLSTSLVFDFFDETEEHSLYKAGHRLIETGIDGLVVAPNSKRDMQRLLPEIGSTPYAFVNTNCGDMCPIIDTSQNPILAGNTAAKIMAMLRPSAKKIITMRRDFGSDMLEQRVKSFTSYLKEQIHAEITDCVIDHTKEISAQIEQIMSHCGHVDGIFIVNTSAYQYIEGIRKVKPDMLSSQDRPAIIGYDVVAKNAALLESDVIDCLISQQPFSQGYNAVKQLILNQALGSKDSSEHHAHVTVIFKENLMSYAHSFRERQ